jgi:hypothetical protein
MAHFLGEDVGCAFKYEAGFGKIEGVSIGPIAKDEGSDILQILAEILTKRDVPQGRESANWGRRSWSGAAITGESSEVAHLSMRISPDSCSSIPCRFSQRPLAGEP